MSRRPITRSEEPLLDTARRRWPTAVPRLAAIPGQASAERTPCLSETIPTAVTGLSAFSSQFWRLSVGEPWIPALCHVRVSRSMVLPMACLAFNAALISAIGTLEGRAGSGQQHVSQFLAPGLVSRCRQNPTRITNSAVDFRVWTPKLSSTGPAQVSIRRVGGIMRWAGLCLTHGCHRVALAVDVQSGRRFRDAFSGQHHYAIGGRRRSEAGRMAVCELL